MKIRKTILLILCILLAAIGFIAWNFFGPVISNPGKKFLYIHTGSTYEDVKDNLVQNGFLHRSFWFDKAASYAGYQNKVKAGKYKITDGMSIYHLLKMLYAGRQEPVNLVITKLRTREDLAKKIAAGFETDSLTAISFLNNDTLLRPFGVDTATAMTLVIPNTYTYYWNTPLKAIIQKLYEEEEKFWNESRLAKAKRLQLTPQQVYTLASIVEEETNKQDDKGRITSVYLNRIRKGMKLAADPTVKYAMRNFALTRIYTKYLEFESPYNTYLYKGLPPGPICTPSIKTIDAVLDAPDTDYLFFVARPDFSGYSDFAATYSQHLQYAKAYQRALDSLMESKKAAAAN